MATAAAPRTGFVRRLITLAIFAGVVFGIVRGLEWYFFAWDREDAGRPPITGTWVGRVNTATQGPRLLLMELHRLRQYRSRAAYFRASMVGPAQLCDGHGRSVPYRMNGTPGDRHATTVSIGAIPLLTPPPAGLELSVVRGRWDGANTMALEAQFHWRNGASASSASNDPDNAWLPFTMRRGTEAEFQAACAAGRAR